MSECVACGDYLHGEDKEPVHVNYYGEPIYSCWECKESSQLRGLIKRDLLLRKEEEEDVLDWTE